MVGCASKIEVLVVSPNHESSQVNRFEAALPRRQLPAKAAVQTPSRDYK